MSCYAYREDPKRFVDIFNRTVEPVVGKCRLLARTCASATSRAGPSGPRRYAPMFPAFLDMHVDEIHVEMAPREFAEIEVIEQITAAGRMSARHHRRQELLRRDARRRGGSRPACLRHAPAERLSVSPDCGLSQTARWAARHKLQNMVEGAVRVRESLSAPA